MVELIEALSFAHSLQASHLYPLRCAEILGLSLVDVNSCVLRGHKT